MTFRPNTLSEIESDIYNYASPRGDPNRVADAGRHPPGPHLRPKT